MHRRALVLVFTVLGCSSSDQTSTVSDSGAPVDGSAATPADASTGDAAAVDAAATAGPLACYIAAEFLCDEYPDPTPAQESDVPGACASKSGLLSRPPACPQADFLGKCTIGTGKGVYVQRRYVGADVATLESFCVNTAMGTWSTTF